MKNIWFTSDHHFGHKNILEFEKEARPFKDLNEMHEVMIERWNSVVKPNDTIYHLGDFAFGKQNIAIAAKLNGKKRLVLGNHDYSAENYKGYFERIYGIKYWERCILTHIPVHPRQLTSRWLMNIHGHLHSQFVHSPRSIFLEDLYYFNVSCERNNLTPIHADIIRARYVETVEE